MTKTAIAFIILLFLAGSGGMAQDSVRAQAGGGVLGRAGVPGRQDSAKTLKKVEVTAPPSAIQFSANKVTLNVAGSPILVGGNAYDALLRVPGLQESQDRLNFRGKSIRILINGRPSPLSGEDLKTMLTGMAASGIDKIEVIPSPPARYEATGGSVVNIVLTRNKAYGTNLIATAGGGFGRFGTANGGFDINHRNKGLNLYGGATYLHNEQYYQTWTDRQLADGNIVSNEYDLRTRNNYGYKLGLDDDISKKASFGFLITGNVNDRKRMVSNNSGINNTGARNPSPNTFSHAQPDSGSIVNTNGRARIQNPTINAYYKLVLDTSGRTININADYLHYNKAWSDSFATRDEALTYMRDNSPADIHVYSWTTDYVHPVKHGRWEAGARVNYTVSNSKDWWANNLNDGTGWVTDTSKTNHFVYKEQINAVYGSHFHSFGRWTAEAGLRVEQTLSSGSLITSGELFRRNFVNFFPNVSIGFTRKPGSQWSFTYRESIQRFGFQYMNPFVIYQSQYAYLQGNPELRPQISHQFSLSGSIGASVVAGLDYTHELHTLGVSYRVVGNETISSYSNFDHSDLVYAYVNYSHKLLKGWQVNLYASAGYFDYSLNTDSVSGQRSNQKPYYAVQAYNSFDLKHGWTAELNLSYTSALVAGVYQRQPFYYADAGISKSLYKGRLSVKAALKDVFNTQISKLYTGFDGVDLHTNTKTESQFFNITARYKFGNNNVRAKRPRESTIGDINSRIN